MWDKSVGRGSILGQLTAVPDKGGMTRESAANSRVLQREIEARCSRMQIKAAPKAVLSQVESRRYKVGTESPNPPHIPMQEVRQVRIMSWGQ